MTTPSTRSSSWTPGAEIERSTASSSGPRRSRRLVAPSAISNGAEAVPVTPCRARRRPGVRHRLSAGKPAPDPPPPAAARPAPHRAVKPVATRASRASSRPRASADARRRPHHAAAGRQRLLFSPGRPAAPGARAPRPSSGQRASAPRDHRPPGPTRPHRVHRHNRRHRGDKGLRVPPARRVPPVRQSRLPPADRPDRGDWGGRATGATGDSWLTSRHRRPRSLSETPGANMCSCRRDATILHADLDAFYASVEQRDDPRLRGRPVIVGAGVVLAASYEARAYGVRTAMGGSAGPPAVPADRRRTPDVGLRRGEQGGVRGVRAHDAAGRGLSIDEAFLDVGGLRRISGRPRRSPCGLRRDVRERVGLPITVGVARTKFLAKVASGVAKPDGLLVVPPDGELAFLHPLPGRTALGRRAGHRRQAARPGDHDGRRGRPGWLRRRWSRSSAGRRAGTCTPSPTTAIPGRCRSAAGGARSGRSAPSAVRRDRPTPSTPCSSPWSTASPAGCARPGGSAEPSCCGCASTTSRAQRGRTR